MRVFYNILDFIGALGGLSVVFLGLTGYLGKLLAKSILQDELAKHNENLELIKHEYQQELENYKSRIDIYKTNMLRYSDNQFKIYNALWKELYNLKISTDHLWETANREKAYKFATQLKKTIDKVETNALLIEKEHYEHLNSIFNSLSNFMIGKYELINLKSIEEVDTYRIEALINQNRDNMVQYEVLLNELFINFRMQVKGEIS